MKDGSLIVFDIGNTNIVVGGFTGSKLDFEFRLRTEHGRTIDEYGVFVLGMLSRFGLSPDSFARAIIASVVPPVTGDLVAVCERYLGISPHIVSVNSNLGIGVNVPDPASVGADRLVNAVAIGGVYGTPGIVIDFGTATTFDIVSADGAFQGGIIAPGVLGSLESLARTTAKLPKIELAWPDSLVGKTTVTNMQAGAVVGYSCLVEGLLEKLEQELGIIPHIVATGGLGELFTKHSRRITQYNPHLTLHGMRIIAERQQ